MKKIFLSLLVASSLFSCSKDEVNETKSVQSVKMNSQRVSEDVFGKIYNNEEGDLKLRIMRSNRDHNKISIVSAEDSKDYFILLDSKVIDAGVNSEFNRYILTGATKFMNTAEKTPFINKFNSILAIPASYNKSAVLDVAKDLSSVVLRAGADSITFTKL
ncbi:hypothetical protein [Flavobacterium oreochromis]|uniref:hypothetical protein n=1 Tax=Flavobacterium oreochromis TaxID=2906078 RepID=UPI00385AE871